MSHVGQAGPDAPALHPGFPSSLVDKAALSVDRHLESIQARERALSNAYDEFCERCEAGEAVNPNEFCARFPPDLQTSLAKLLEAHDILSPAIEQLEQEEEEKTKKAQDSIPDWPRPGQRFLRFTMLAPLGRGAFSRVYLAREPALGNRLVVVKISDRPSREAETLGPLNHPNIVPIHSVHRAGPTGLTLVCMPYQGSATLGHLLDRVFAGGRLPTHSRVILDAAQDTPVPRNLAAGGPPGDPVIGRGTYIDGIIRIGADLAEALAFIHSRGVYHRDLKPSNVLLTPAGQPMLLDFNLAHDDRFGGGQGGTVPYMSPEQLRAAGRLASWDALDARSDLFSLGVILHELLTGRHPFGRLPACEFDEHLCQHLLKRQARGPVPLRRGNPQVDRRLAQVIERCLAFDPGQRHQSAAELAVDLRRSLAPVQRARRWASCHRFSLLTAVAFVLLGVLATGYYLVAVRDPSGVRQFQRGVAASQRGHYRDAVESFNRVLAEEPDHLQARFGRARAYQQLGRITQALDDYTAVDQRAPAGRLKACQGYCFNRLENHPAAIKLYRKAIQAGFAPAEVYNNLGYSHLKLGLKEHRDQARRHLLKAIADNPKLQAAFYNLAVIDLQTALTTNSGYVPRDGMKWMDQAIALGVPTADLYFTAAVVCGVAAQRDPRYAGKVLKYFKQAVRLGADPLRLLNDGSLRSVKPRLQDDKQVQQWLRKPPRARPRRATLQLVDPLRDTAD